MIAIILGVLLLILGAALIVAGVILLFGKLLRNPFATFIIGCITGAKLKN